MDHSQRVVPSGITENSYISFKYKLLYVAVEKAACTSLKHHFAAIQGEDLNYIEASRSAESTVSMTIHDRARWLNTPLALGSNLDEVLGDEWFRYAVVRDPARRLFSAWQSKILLRETYWVDRYGNESWFPPRVLIASDVSTFYRAFVAELAVNPELRAESHWAPQAEYLGLPDIRYSFLEDVSKLSQLKDPLLAQMRSNGWTQDLPPIPRLNWTPVEYQPEFNGPNEVAILSEFYREDYEMLPYDPATASQGIAQVSDRELAIANHLIDRMERFSHVWRVGINQRSFNQKVSESVRSRATQLKRRKLSKNQP